jgi:NodT family efflux transporter outer membrane factor (OMF) lipoprotein
MNRYLFMLFIGAWIQSCIPAKPVLPASPELPASFHLDSSTTLADSGSAASIQWSDFFADTALHRLVETGLAQNLDMKIAYQRIEMAKSNHLYARSFLRPEVNLNLASSLRRFGLYTMDGAGNITTDISPGKIVPINLPDYFPAIQASWEVDIWGKLKNQKKAAFSRVLASQEARQLLKTELVASLATGYYELLALQQTTRLLQQTIAFQQEAMKMMEVQKQAGRLNELAIKQFAALTKNMESAVVEIKQAQVEEQNRMLLLTGQYVPVVYPDTSLQLQAIEANRLTIGSPGELLRNRPDIRQAEWELIAAKADLNSARAAFYPALTLTGYGGYQAFNPGYLFRSPESIAYGLFGGITAPLLNRAAIKATFNQAGAAQLESLYSYQKTVLQAYMEVATEQKRLENLLELTTIKREEVQFLRDAIAISLDLFNRGKVTYLDVLIARQAALEAEMSLIEINKRLLLGRVSLYRSLGGGWNNQ